MLLNNGEDLDVEKLKKFIKTIVSRVEYGFFPAIRVNL
jgi:hypothetical protein